MLDMSSMQYCEELQMLASRHTLLFFYKSINISCSQLANVFENEHIDVERKLICWARTRGWTTAKFKHWYPTKDDILKKRMYIVNLMSEYSHNNVVAEDNTKDNTKDYVNINVTKRITKLQM